MALEPRRAAEEPNAMEPMPAEQLANRVHAAHRALLPALHELADADRWSRTGSTATVRARLTAALDFLLDELVPHTAVDEETIYPAIARLVGPQGDTDALCRYHLEVTRLAAELRTIRDDLDEPVTAAQREHIVALLRGLHAIVALHIAKEEKIYLPMLDRGLTAAEAAQLARRMDDVAERRRALVA
jgi:iron-sulfur cluster repair protein YtfE (RIC family)